MKELIIPIGIAGSGKSTFIDKYYDTCQIVCLDDIRKAFGDIFNPRTEPIIRGIGEVMARAVMERNRSLVIDSTNTTEGIILKYLKLAKEYDYNTICVKFIVPLEICIKRKEGINKLTKEVFERQYKQISEINDSFIFDSFEKIYYVDENSYINKVK